MELYLKSTKATSILDVHGKATVIESCVIELLISIYTASADTKQTCRLAKQNH